MKNRVSLCVLTMIVLTGSIVGCDRFQTSVISQPVDPVLFQSASPPSGSTIKADATITVTFDDTPENVSVNQGEFVKSGSNTVTLSGSYKIGELELKLTWADGGYQILNYTVESDTSIDNVGEENGPKGSDTMNGGVNTGNGSKEPDPVQFRSADPPSGSKIKAGATITVTFDGTPENVSVNQGNVEKSGSSAVTLSGPYEVGKLELKLTWADGGYQTLNYTVERARDGKIDIGDKVIAQNTVDEVNNIRGLRIRTGPGINFNVLGRVHDNATGIVIDGPRNANGYTWWKVSWNPGNLNCSENPCEGWSAEFVNGAFVLAEN